MLFNKIFPQRRDVFYALFGFVAIGSLALLVHPNSNLVLWLWP